MTSAPISSIVQFWVLVPLSGGTCLYLRPSASHLALALGLVLGTSSIYAGWHLFSVCKALKPSGANPFMPPSQAAFSSHFFLLLIFFCLLSFSPRLEFTSLVSHICGGSLPTQTPEGTGCDFSLRSLISRTSGLPRLKQGLPNVQSADSPQQLVKHRLLPPLPPARVSDSAGLQRGPEMCISYRFPVLLLQRLHVGNHWPGAQLPLADHRPGC